MASLTVIKPQTIASVMAVAVSGDTIYVHEGTYLERVTMKSGVSLSAVGEVYIDATGITGFGSCIEIQGVHDVLVEGFHIINGGASPTWTNVEGIAIRDSNGGNGGTGSYNITIRNCTFRNILPKPATPNSLGIPIIIYSYSDSRIGETGCHHVLVEDCDFRDCNPANQVGIFVGYLNIVGNCEYIEVKNNYFYHDYDLYTSLASCIEMGGNYAPAWPATPRFCTISGNTFEAPYPAVQQGQSVYLTNCHDCIVERNHIKNWSIGPVVAAEAGDMNEFTSYNIIIRRNLIQSYYSSVIVGAFSSFYMPVYNIWVDSNTCYGSVDENSSLGQGPTEGLLVTNNLLLNGVTGLHTASHNTTENVIRIDNLYANTPDWVIFNTTELDLNGSRQKLTRGAEEKSWMSRQGYEQLY